MPLNFICQCCLCKNSLSQELWSISRDHKYSESRYVCSHFDVEIDHQSSIGFWGIGWRNTITIRAHYKPSGTKKTVISKTFDSNNTEYQDYAVFDSKVVFHGRISDYDGRYPDCGNSIQNNIEY